MGTQEHVLSSQGPCRQIFVQRDLWANLVMRRTGRLLEVGHLDIQVIYIPGMIYCIWFYRCVQDFG